MKIAILGAGALGGYYGARLAESGQDVTFILRSEYDYIHAHGMDIQSIDGDIQINHPSIARSPQEVGPVDMVIVSWKTISNDHLAEALPPMLKADTIVLTLQNGMGNAEVISSIVPSDRIYIGMCFICAMRTAPGVFAHTSGGSVQIAPYAKSPAGLAKAQELADMFKHAKTPARAYDNAEEIQWFKLVWNIPYNGLCLAKGGISIGELYEDPGNIKRVRTIMEEIVHTAKLRGCTLPDDIIDFQMNRTVNMEGFIPSSAVDYIKGRPIEYHAIWGAPLAKAHEVNSPVPEWEKLDAEIRTRLGL